MSGFLSSSVYDCPFLYSFSHTGFLREKMATASTLEEQATCPICSGPYKEARKLPGCSHSFCETCILTYVLNLKKDAKLETSFQCPVCRLPSDAPDNGDITHEWIQSMDKTKATSSKLASDLYESCNQCSCLEKFTKATYYCVDCKECFCETCSKTFHSFKFASNHVLIKLASETENINVHNEALIMLEKFLNCSTHIRQPVAFYCESEKQFVCVECAVDKHRHCSTKKIVELADQHEVETMSKTLVTSFKKLLCHTQSVIKMIQEHDQETKSDQEMLLDEFFTLKQKVTQQFDTLEELLKSESKAMCKEIAIKNLDEIDGLKEFGQRLSVITYLIENLAGKIPAKLACICIHEASNILKQMKKATKDRGQSRDKTSFMLKIENMLKTLLDLGPNELSQIASVQMVNNTIPLPEYDRDNCLRKCTVKKNRTDTVVAEYSRGLKPCYYGVLFLPDDKMILSDMLFGSVCLTDENSKLISSYRLGDNAPTLLSNQNLNLICATTMTNKNIAVSVYDKRMIYFFSADKTLKYRGEIGCNNTPVAIHGLRNNDLAILWNAPWAFGIIALTGGSYHEKVYFNKDKNQKELTSNGFMAVDEALDHVILPSVIDQTIYCYDFEGTQVFAYNDINIVSPRGVAIDGDGNIYVCEEKQGTIIVLSPSGNLSRIIKNESPTQPLGIGFKEDGKTFAVTQFGPRSADVQFLSLTDS